MSYYQKMLVVPHQTFKKIMNADWWPLHVIPPLMAAGSWLLVVWAILANPIPCRVVKDRNCYIFTATTLLPHLMMLGRVMIRWPIELLKRWPPMAMILTWCCSDRELTIAVDSHRLLGDPFCHKHINGQHQGRRYTDRFTQHTFNEYTVQYKGTPKNRTPQREDPGLVSTVPFCFIGSRRLRYENRTLKKTQALH